MCFYSPSVSPSIIADLLTCTLHGSPGECNDTRPLLLNYTRGLGTRLKHVVRVKAGCTKVTYYCYSSKKVVGMFTVVKWPVASVLTQHVPNCPITATCSCT